MNGVSLDEVDLVICGGIARQYFEPATAMEVAAKLGLKRTHAFDVTAACVGHLEAIQTAAGYLALHDNYRTALVCTSELSGQFLSYDIQSVRDLALKTAGLTIGNAAACMLLRKKPFPNGGIRLKRDQHVHGARSLASLSGPDQRHAGLVVRRADAPGQVHPAVGDGAARRLGLKPNDIDHYIFHQPSEIMLRKILSDIGVDPDKGVYTHSLYGNTASASIGVTYRQLLEERRVKVGDKLVLGSAAAGYSMVMATGEWTGHLSERF